MPFVFSYPFCTGTNTSESLAVKTHFPDIKITLSDNQAYDMITKADRNAEKIVKQDAVYETIK